MPDQDKTAVIKADLAAGKTKEAIYQDLLQAGESLASIEAYFERIESEKGGGVQNRAVRIMLVIGGIFVGLSYLSFVAASWDSFDKLAQTLILIGSTALLYFLGWYFRYQKQLTTTGDLLFILGAFLFGISWFVLAGVYGTELRWQDGFVIWLIGCLVTARLSQVFPVYYLAVILGVIAAFGYVDLIYSEPTPAYNYYYVEDTSPEPLELPTGLMLFAGAVVTGVFGYDMRRRLKTNPPQPEATHVR